MPDHCVTREQLAGILGISPRYVNALVKDGMPKTGRGRYDLAACVQWYAQVLKDRAATVDRSMSEEQKRLIIAKRKKTEEETKAMRASMIPVEKVTHELDQIERIVSKHLDGLGIGQINTLASLTEPGKIQDLLFQECRQVRSDLAKAIKDYA